MKKIFFTIAACVNLTFLPAQIISFTNQGYRVEGERLAQKGMSGLAYALDGVFPGVQVVRENINGQTIPKLTYHGTASGLIDMTVYVNGIEYVGSLDMININDIESVTLLREGQNVKYGHRSAEGVILIEMKKARAGKFSLTFQNQTGITTKSLPYYEVMNDPTQVAEMIWECEYNRSWDAESASYSRLLRPGYTTSISNGYYKLGYRLPFQVDGLVVNTDGKINPEAKLLWHDKWRDEMVSAGFRQENHISVSGGDKLFNARGSFGFVHEDGYLDATGTDRFSGLVSLRSEPASWVKLGADIQASLMDSKQREQDYYYVHHDSPFRLIYNRTESGAKEKIDGSYYYLPYDYYSTFPNYNAMASDSSRFSKRKEKMLQGNFFAEFRYKGFYAGVKASGSWMNNDIEDRFDKGSLLQIDMLDKELTRVTATQYLGWEGAFGKNRLGANIAHQDIFHDGYNRMLNKVQIFTSGRGDSLVINNPGEKMSHGFNWSFGLNYDYDQRYYLHASGLIEKQPAYYERIATPVERSFYYSAGAQWNLKNETFLKQAKKLNELSLFFNWGEMKPELFEHQVLMGVRPEKFMFLSSGLNTRFFDCIYLSASYFQRDVTNLIVMEAQGHQVDSYDSYENDYYVRTSGVDINLQAEIIKSQNWFWQAGLNLSHFRQMVRSEKLITSDTKYIMKGTDLHRYINENLKFELGENYGEFTKTGEQKADKKPEPDLFGGLITNVRYKNFDLNLGFTFALGGYVYDQTYRSLLDGEQFVWHKDMEKRWRLGADNKDAGLPQLGKSNRNNPYVLTSGSYFAFDNVNVGYSFEQAKLRKLGLSNLRVFLTGTNLFLISARKGFDPRSVYGYGIKHKEDRYVKNYSYANSVPLLRTFSLGLTMTL